MYYVTQLAAKLTTIITVLHYHVFSDYVLVRQTVLWNSDVTRFVAAVRLTMKAISANFLWQDNEHKARHSDVLQGS
jgi:hypothetical protein